MDVPRQARPIAVQCAYRKFVVSVIVVGSMEGGPTWWATRLEERPHNHTDYLYCAPNFRTRKFGAQPNFDFGVLPVGDQSYGT